jgi:drug/metabolite transporter (DMT)-like permease
MITFQIAGIWALNILFDTSGHFAFKLAAIEPDANASNREHWRHMLARPWLWFGLACFIGEFLAWLAFLSLVPLAQGVLLGMVSTVIVMLCGRIAFHEYLTPPRIIGMTLILFGVAIVGI